MSKQTEAMKLALDALEYSKDSDHPHYEDQIKAITALREALAEQPAQQEPVGYFRVNDYGRWEENENEHGQPFYTPPQAQPAREPLTDEQIMAIGKELGVKCRLGGNPNIDFEYARAIEAAHGITKGNT